MAGYHEHFVRRLQIARRRHLSAEALVVHIRAVYAANGGAYGWPRIWRALRAQGIRVGKQRVQQLMQQHGQRLRAFVVGKNGSSSPLFERDVELYSWSARSFMYQSE